MDGGKAIFFNHALGNEDGILKVVTVPGHKGDAHILTQRQLTQVDRRAIGQNIATLNQVAFFHNRALVDAGVLVRTGVLGVVVNIHRRLTGLYLGVIGAHYDAAGIDRIHHTGTAGDFTHTGVSSHIALDAGAN